MTSQRSSRDLSTVTPYRFHFVGTTDNEGKLELSFKDKNVVFTVHHEVGLDSFNIAMDSLVNTSEEESYFVVTNSSNTGERFNLHGLLATLQDVVVSFNIATKQRVLLSSKADGFLQLTLAAGDKSILLTHALARSLGILNSRKEVSDFFKFRNAHITTTTTTDRSNWRKGTVSLAFAASSSRTTIDLTRQIHESCWEDISSRSFQAILVDTNLSEVNYVGSQSTQNIAIFAADPYADAIHIEPSHVTYHRLSKWRFDKVFIRLATSSGEVLKGARINVTLRIRRRNLK